MLSSATSTYAVILSQVFSMYASHYPRYGVLPTCLEQTRLRGECSDMGICVQMAIMAWVNDVRDLARSVTLSKSTPTNPKVSPIYCAPSWHIFTIHSHGYSQSSTTACAGTAAGFDTQVWSGSRSEYSEVLSHKAFLK